MKIKENKKVDMGAFNIIYGEFIPNEDENHYENAIAYLNGFLEDWYGPQNIIPSDNSYVVDWEFSISVKK